MNADYRRATSVQAAIGGLSAMGRSGMAELEDRAEAAAGAALGSSRSRIEHSDRYGGLAGFAKERVRAEVSS